MKRCYIYLHRRLDNNCVFYIGKGTGARHSQTTKRSKGWRDVVKEAGGFNVEILKDNLEDAEAYKLESDLITNPDESWILVNKNNFKNIVELDLTYLMSGFTMTRLRLRV